MSNMRSASLASAVERAAPWLAPPVVAFLFFAIHNGIAAPPDAPSATQPVELPGSAPLPLPPPLPKLPSLGQASPATAPPTTGAAAPSNSQSPSSPAPATAPALVQPAAPAESQLITAESQPANSPEQANAANQLQGVTVTADLDRTRDQIAPALGAVAYTIGQNQIEDTPGGQNASFQQVLLRAPGVVEDSYGQEHVRGEHANLTYRVNGVLLPQPVNVFGQEVDTRLVASTTLIDGTLPAQFGFHTAGVVDITTKSGETLKHNELSVYGGMDDTIEPSIEVGGSNGKLDYFVTSTVNHNALGIENPTPSHIAIHDDTDQERLFAFLSYHIDDTSRLSLFVNAYNGEFQIPDEKGLPPLYTLAGHPTANSAMTNENQNEEEYYAVIAYQKAVDKLSYQLSGFTRYGQITFNPDYANDLIFQGTSAAVYNSFLTEGIQLDGSYALNAQHTIRAGLIADYTTEKQDSTSAVFAANSAGAQSSNVPFDVDAHTSAEATEAGIYIQDEFQLAKPLTLNVGARYDRFDASFDHEGQLSPRANLVYKIDKATTFHAGYSRYFVPPPVQYVAPGTIARFYGTTNAPASPGDNAPRVERSDYYDVGISRQISAPLFINIDGFYKQAHQLVDLGQFGDAIILSPYNYAQGTIGGAEFSATYKQGGFSGFANFSYVKTLAHDIDTQQFSFPSDELAYIAAHNIKLDHEAEYTVSAGAAYAWPDNRVHIDMLYGSGLRAGFANLIQEPQYYPVNVGYEHTFRGGFWGKNNVKFRLDILNIFDQSYQLRSGAGLGVNAPQYGQRIAVYSGLTYEF